MSGICGLIFADASRSVDSALVADMCAALGSGPPGAVSTAVDRNVGLGVFRRWPSQQVYSEAGLRLACDAELYNLDEISSLLGRRLTAAEAIVGLYVRYGAGCVEKLRGEFAFALWDRPGGLLLLATDRFGIRPLNYYQDEEQFAFASKIKALFCCRDIPRALNSAAIISYLNFSVVPTPDTIYRDVYKLPPGHLLILRDGKARLEKYWDMEYREGEGAEEVYAAALRKRIEEAVAVCLADLERGRFGAFLSGGTDSSTVVGMASLLTGGRVKTFSIGFEEDGYNEISYARITARHFGTEHREYFVKPRDVVEVIPNLAREYDEPFGNASAVPTYCCARLAAESGVDTMLAGDGGDELFAGNERYLTEKILGIYQQVPEILRKRTMEPLLSLIPFNPSLLAKARSYIWRSNLPNPYRFFSYNFLMSMDPKELFDGDFLREVRGDGLLAVAEQHYRAARAESELNRLLYIDLKLTITDNDLRKVNRTADLAGVRVRFPLLDYKLAGFSGEIPAGLKLKGFTKKYIFKRALRDLLPSETLRKKKHGFGMPTGQWLKNNRALRELARDLLLSSRARSRGYFKTGAIEQLFEKNQNEHAAYYGNILWLFLMLELWHREHLDSR